MADAKKLGVATRVPGRCAVPTGLGKNSVIAAWLVALGQSLAKPIPNVSVPRRLVYVVDRRTVVDQASDEAREIRERLLRAEVGSPLGDLRSELRSASALPDATGVTISTLRGQFADNHEWDLDASRPAIIVGTIDMIGSRLLFSDYGGLGRHRRSLHAGLLAQDSLIVIDEAHLSPAFAQTLISIREQARSTALRPFDLMLLTATQPRLFDAPASGNSVTDIRIENYDLEVEEVRRRLRAEKLLHFIALDAATEGGKAKPDGEAIALRMAAEAVRLAGNEHAVVVFANTVDLENRISAALKAEPPKIPEAQRRALTGEMRGKERDEFAHSEFFVRNFQTRSGERGPLPAPHFLITTAAGEVGVNFDADHAVCDLVSLERMAQRLGRVNRFGGGSASIHLVLAMKPEVLHADVEELESLIAELPGTESDVRYGIEKRIAELEKTLNRVLKRPLTIARVTCCASARRRRRKPRSVLRRCSLASAGGSSLTSRRW